jgi:hypothetical protein
MAVPYSVNDMVFTPARPRLWSRQPLAAEPGPNPYPYAVSADGQRIVAVVPDPASEEYSRRNVTLWVNALSDFGRRIGTGH